jgi:hypothetical protein
MNAREFASYYNSKRPCVIDHDHDCILLHRAIIVGSKRRFAMRVSPLPRGRRLPMLSPNPRAVLVPLYSLEQRVKMHARLPSTIVMAPECCWWSVGQPHPPSLVAYCRKMMYVRTVQDLPVPHSLLGPTVSHLKVSQFKKHQQLTINPLQQQDKSNRSI